MGTTLTTLLVFFFSAAVFAQAVEVPEDAPVKGTGRDHAAGYFRDRQADRAAKGAGGDAGFTADPGAKPRYLAVHAGSFFTDQAYKWGKGDQTNLGKLNVGVDYRIGEWVNAADFSLRIDFTGFELDEGTARKLSVTGMLTFPDVNSRFPLYFGLAIGPGFFLKQVRTESVLSLDYSLLAGARLFDVIEKIGFMVEVGLKDHLLVFSDGQYNGLYFNVGTVFAF